jgi:signal transduction histidine kinase
MGYSERLSKDGISQERKERYLDILYGKSAEIQQLVNEFDEYLGYNMPQKLRTETVSVSELVHIINDEFSEELELSGVKLNINNTAGNSKIHIDSAKFKRVFGNIFSNSIKHFTNREKVIDVTISSDKKKVYINIADSGDGVAEEKLDIIFEPLYTSDEGRKVAGLGLAICREIIDSHGGKIYARPSEYGGLEICIEIDRSDKKTSIFSNN